MVAVRSIKQIWVDIYKAHFLTHILISLSVSWAWSFSLSSGLTAILHHLVYMTQRHSTLSRHSAPVWIFVQTLESWTMIVFSTDSGNEGLTANLLSTHVNKNIEHGICTRSKIVAMSVIVIFMYKQIFKLTCRSC